MVDHPRRRGEPRPHILSEKVNRDSGCSTCGGLRRRTFRAMMVSENALVDETADRPPQRGARYARISTAALARQNVALRETAGGDSRFNAALTTRMGTRSALPFSDPASSTPTQEVHAARVPIQEGLGWYAYRSRAEIGRPGTQAEPARWLVAARVGRRASPGSGADRGAGLRFKLNRGHET